MPKITKRGPSVRVFESPATVLRQRGKLGPYGGEARVEDYTTVSEASVVPPAAGASGEPSPAVVEPASEPEGSGSDAGEPRTADVRAWARDHGYEVAASGKVAQEIVDAYKAAHSHQLQPESVRHTSGSQEV